MVGEVVDLEHSTRSRMGFRIDGVKILYIILTSVMCVPLNFFLFGGRGKGGRLIK